MSGQRVTIISGLTSLSLLIIKLLIGLTFNNSLLISDALDNAFDLLLMIAAWFGLKLSSREPDKRFPFGYYKAESLISLLLSIAILLVAGSLIIQGFNETLNPKPLNGDLLLIITALTSFTTSLLLSRFLKKHGLKLRSQLLVTSASERLSDAFKSLIILASFVLALIGFNFTGLLTIIVSLIVFRVGLSAIKDSVLALMDAAPKGLIDEVSPLIRKVRGVIGFKDLRLRSAGSLVFGEVTIIVSKNLSVSKAHLIASSVEQAVKGLVELMVVHVEPAGFSEGLVAIPVNEDKGLESLPAKQFARAKGFLLIKVSGGRAVANDFRLNPFAGSRVRAGLSVAKFLVNLGVNALITKEVGEVAFHSLRDNLVDVFIAKQLSAQSLINQLISGGLKVFNSPSRVK